MNAEPTKNVGARIHDVESEVQRAGDELKQKALVDGMLPRPACGECNGLLLDV